MTETKSQILARIDEREKVQVEDGRGQDVRIDELKKSLETADEDLLRSIVRSHKVICEIKQMSETEAYGQNPAVYFSLAVCGEAGELGNKIVKALRNGDDPDATRQAVISELPDVFIYGAVLAYVLDIDITKLVNEKADIVIERAKNGYYGGPLARPSSPPKPDRSKPKPDRSKPKPDRSKPKPPMSLPGPAPAPRVYWNPEFQKSVVKTDLIWVIVGLCAAFMGYLMLSK